MKVLMYTHIKKPAGNVLPNTAEVIEAQSVNDKGDHYEVAVHSNRTLLLTKKYWSVQIF